MYTNESGVSPPKDKQCTQMAKFPAYRRNWPICVHCCSRTQFAQAVRAHAHRRLGHARAIVSSVAAAAEQSAHDLLGAGPVVAGKCRDLLAQAQLVEVILEFAQAGTQLVDLALSLLRALLHV